MNNQYYICCVPGSCGMFLSTVIAKYLGHDCPTEIAATGHCHDLGQGIWRSNSCIELFGDHWNGSASKHPVVFSHCADFARVRAVMPNIKVVLIDYDHTDIVQISTFRTLKAYTLQWTQEEYNKVAGPDWPSYHVDNLIQSKLIRDECIAFRVPDTKRWIDNVDKTQVDYILNFKTIYSGNLNSAVADMLGVAESQEISEFIKQYQQINLEYYYLLGNQS